MNEETTLEPADADARHEAVFGTDSYIVQAPAGSGKTELLVQRYLRLLASVDQPDNVLAITFTNKAAAEMRERILDALQKARGPRPLAPHAVRTWQLGQAVLARDTSARWELEQSPRLLRVQTIDALCAGLARQLPVLSGFGSNASATADAEPLYRQAARMLLNAVEREDDGGPIWRLLGHLDGSTSRFLTLVTEALRQRERWLGHVVADGSDFERTTLETTLARLAEVELEQLARVMPQGTLTTARHVARDACAFFKTNASRAKGPLYACPDAAHAEDPINAAALPVWRALGEVLLTQKGEPRKRLDNNCGVPPEKPGGEKIDDIERARRREHKERAETLLATLSEVPDVLALLQEIRGLPDPNYSDDQWEVVKAITAVLPIAYAYLRIVFGERGEADFGEIQNGALQSLRDHDSPSELLIALDARISHILIDEFQDTSASQMNLMQTLVTDWSNGDGRSLFVVGDPMQSIYRFRQAEIGNFLQAQRQGIAHVKLQPLVLKTNFRSTAPVVDWINNSFERVFPAIDNEVVGAVRYSSAVAHQEGHAGDGVTIHPLVEASEEAEALKVVELVQTSLAEHDGDVAILVRSRTHLRALLPRLRDASITVQAVDAEALGDRQVVRDLHALTRALTHPADSAAWLAVLRAPYCGITLSDLHTLFAGNAHWSNVVTGLEPLPRFTGDAGARLRRLVNAFIMARRERHYRSLAGTVERLWLMLGGPQCLDAANMLEDARSYLALLARYERAGEVPDETAFVKAMEGLYAAPEASSEARVQVMTMHKAKGLEFDTVILPGLNRTPRGSTKPILHVERRRVSTSGRTRRDDPLELLVAPVEGPGQEDPLFQWMNDMESKRERAEAARLLYVAATRARHRAHLVASVGWSIKTGTIKPPQASTLLAHLWPVVEADFEALRAPTAALEASLEEESADAVAPLLTRVTDEWLDAHSVDEPLSTDAEQLHIDAYSVGAEVEFDWAGENARHVGTLVHRYIERITLDGPEAWPANRIGAHHSAFEAGLVNLGVANASVRHAADRVRDALLGMLGDDRGRWLLTAHQDGAAELGLGHRTHQAVHEYVVDRTFVDSGGTRWIVDYKTGGHEGGGLQGFLDSEQERYAPQLEGYARILMRIDSRPTRLGLYFPVIGAWREWAAGIQP